MLRYFRFQATGRCKDRFFSTTNFFEVENLGDYGVKKKPSFAKSLACLTQESYAPDNAKASASTGHSGLENGSNAREFQGVARGAWIEVDASEHNGQPVSLAKRLACLPEEGSRENKKQRTRMELKRSIEMRIKKRVKEQLVHGKFRDIMEKVVLEPCTLRDSYNIVRLNSNVDLASQDDELCFDSMAEELRTGDFDIKSSTWLFSTKDSKECLVLPNLKLRVIQEAIRIVLEVVYRPYFSKISHGCRSGRGIMSTLRYVSNEMYKADWWFTLQMKKKADAAILSSLLSIMQEKIEDSKLFSIIQLMFDAKVLCLDFGCYPKGHGLPQEGVLSPILMNIYLDNLDSELFRISLRHEGVRGDVNNTSNGPSKLRHWFRRQIKGNKAEAMGNDSGLRLHACRYMDELIIAVSGPKDTAVNVNREIRDYLKQSLYIDTMDQTDLVAVSGASSSGIQFLGMSIRVAPRETGALRAVHKLKDKIRLFAAQKQDAWNTAMVRIGKKWLAHGLKRIKESEIKQLGLSSPLLDKISHHRKKGMTTEHWFNVLVKVWLLDVNAAADKSVKAVLSKYVAEPALPQELRDSFYRFQTCAEEYVSCETSSTLELLLGDAKKAPPPMVTMIDAPLYHIQKKLMNYGLVNREGIPRYVSFLVLHDDALIVHFFSGLINRWLKWYSKHHNYEELKYMILEYVKKSCIRTLAAKHKVNENLIEKRFELELNSIPLTEDLEIDLFASTSSPCNDEDEALMYGIYHSGLCRLTVSRIEELSQHFNCSVMGCLAGAPCTYTLDARDQQRSGQKTGFATGIHPALNGVKIALCNHHVKDLYLGDISLQSIEFGSLSK